MNTVLFSVHYKASRRLKETIFNENNEQRKIKKCMEHVIEKKSLLHNGERYGNYDIGRWKGEPRVIMAIYTEKQYEMVEVIAKDLGEILLQKVMMALERK